MLAPLSDGDPPAIGPYRLGGRLGAGGMGVVYLGFGPDDHPVAVKMPAPELARDPRFRARFRREVAAAQLINSNSVAAVVGADTEAESPWLATEFIQGATLLDAVQGRGPLAARLITGFAAGLADGLVAMHAVGVVHRDLKPANIILAWDGPKIIDFGVALTTTPVLGTSTADEPSDPDVTQARTQDGQRLGTFVWMSPEQLLGGNVGPASDVFAWGACVTYATAGHSPFRAASAAETIARIQRDPPDLDGVPPQLADLVEATLAKDPADRPPATALVGRLLHREVRTPVESDRAVETALLPWVAQPPTPPPLRPEQDRTTEVVGRARPLPREHSPRTPAGDAGGPDRAVSPRMAGHADASWDSGETPWDQVTLLPGGAARDDRSPGGDNPGGGAAPAGSGGGQPGRLPGGSGPLRTIRSVGPGRPSRTVRAALVGGAVLVLAGAAVLGVVLAQPHGAGGSGGDPGSGNAPAIVLPGGELAGATATLPASVGPSAGASSAPGPTTLSSGRPGGTSRPASAGPSGRAASTRAATTGTSATAVSPTPAHSPSTAVTTGSSPTSSPSTTPAGDPTSSSPSTTTAVPTTSTADPGDGGSPGDDAGSGEGTAALPS